MMFLTVIFNILVVTTAIRVPPVWPEQERRIQDLQVEQNTYLSNTPQANFKIIRNRKNANANRANYKGIYIPELEQKTPDAFYISSPLVQNKRHPSGSLAEFVIIDTGKTQNLKDDYNNVREPDVRYTVPHFIKNKSNAVSHVNIATKNKKEHKVYYNREDPSMTKTRHNNPKTNSFSQPVVYVDNNVNFPTFADGWMPIIAQQNPHKIQESNNVHTYHNLNHERYQISDRAVNQRHAQPLKVRRQYKDPRDRLDVHPTNNYQYIPQNRQAIISRNYRDDITQEPSNEETIAEENENVENEDDETEGEEKLQMRDFESLKTVPTKPIYPGEGKWAIRGIEHRPFIRNHEYKVLQDDTEERPEGYETFERTAPTFERQQRMFSAKLRAFPQEHGLQRGTINQQQAAEEEDHEEVKEEQEEEDQEEQKGEDDFIPTRTLAQVRKSETEEYLPRDPEDARLREVIKDSKIHTVYTEEGYEDIAYDHEGHEKHAEDSEGQAQFNKNADKVKIPKRKKLGFEAVDVEKEFEKYSPPPEEETSKPEAEEALDADVSASSYNDAHPKKNITINDFTTTKENRTKEIKDMDDEMELEITSEIKIMTKPNNVSTAHKFVKIVPKNKNKVSTDDANSGEVVKRRKRYVNDFYKIDVDKDFLDVLVSENPQALPVTTEKYPYYNIKNTNVLNKNSPLRYAEDLRNVPIKIPGRMSFYERSKISECPEIPRNIDPIPDRVKKAENKGKKGSESKGNGFAGLPDVPRLRNLGDKIDCLKMKLFGENPLDSPIFQESVIDAPSSIFKELDPVDDIIKIYSGADLENNEKLLRKVEEIPIDVASHLEEINERLDEDEDEGPKGNYKYNKEDERDNPAEAYSSWDADEDYDEREEDGDNHAEKAKQNVPVNDFIRLYQENEDNHSLRKSEKSQEQNRDNSATDQLLDLNKENEDNYSGVDEPTQSNEENKDGENSYGSINNIKEFNENDEDNYNTVRESKYNKKEENDSRSSIKKSEKSDKEDENNYPVLSELESSDQVDREGNKRIKPGNKGEGEGHTAFDESIKSNRRDENNPSSINQHAESIKEYEDDQLYNFDEATERLFSDDKEEENAEKFEYFTPQKPATLKPFPDTFIPKRIYDRIDYIQRLATSEEPILEEEDSNDQVNLVQNLETSSDASVFKSSSITESPVSAVSPHDQTIQTTERIATIPRHIYDRIDETQRITTSQAPISKKEDVTTESYNQVNLVQNLETSSEVYVIKSTPNTNLPVSEPSLHNQIVQTTEKIVSSTAATPTKIEVIKPKHIYDQIDILNASEEGTVNFVNNNGNAQRLTQDFNQISNQNNNNIPDNRRQKSLDTLYEPNLNKENSTNNNLIDSQSINVKPTNAAETLPETAALRILLKRRRRPQVRHRPRVQIFDVTKFLPTPLPPPILTYSASTILPKYKTLSEVYYKDDIQPNEQLNVFADVINNIKNSPQEPLAAAGSEYFPTVQESWNTVNTPKSTGKKIKVPPRKIRIKHNDSASSYSTINNNIYKISSTTTTTTTTTAPPRKRRRNKYKNHKPDPQIYEEYLQTVKENADFSKVNSKEPEVSQTIHSYKKKKQPEVSNVKDSYFLDGTSFYNPILNQEIFTGVVDDVIGLSPPAPSSLQEASTLNTYVVSGMKPPNIGKPYVYSTFRLPQNNRIRRKNYYHRISKRSPVKPSYSEIRRNRPAQSNESKEEKEEEEEEEDDYVPKRNRNFHYDVENHKVVYLNKKEEPKEEIVPETQEVEEEDEGEYLTITKPDPKPEFVVMTTEKNGPSFLEYVHQLKNNSNYRLILDPVPTKKPSDEPKEKEDLKEMESTTSKQIETVVPEFLSIISKLKSADGYKEIKDKKQKSTTTAAPEEEEEEIEAAVEEIEGPELQNVRNSPGAAQDSNNFDRKQIFDITEYLPQPKNYSPKTVIDYSKYKTIQRAPVATRHNLSSRYNSEDDELPLRNRFTTQLPILATSEDNIKSGSSEEGVVGNKRSRGNTRRSGYSSSEETAEDEEKSTTQFVELTTTHPTRARPKNRRRPTTTTTTPLPTVSTTSPRRRTRLRSRPTTTAEPLLEGTYSHTQRVVQRRKIPAERLSRQDQKIPSNHKAFYTPIVIEDRQNQPKAPVVQRKRKVPRIVVPQQILRPRNVTEKPKGTDKIDEVKSSKLEQVQVFQKYDPNKRHGGNYRREEEKKEKEDNSEQAVEVNSVSPVAYKSEDSEKVERLTDVVPKPYAFYTDSTLPKNINRLKDPKATESLSSGESDETEFPPVTKHASVKDYSEEYQDEVKINFNNKNSETVTKKPVHFVKDPSKRLYFYAPVK